MVLDGMDFTMNEGKVYALGNNQLNDSIYSFSQLGQAEAVRAPLHG
jgi:hypothetical protein